MISVGFFDIDAVVANVFCPSLEAKVIMLNNSYVLAETGKQMYEIFLMACKHLIADEKGRENLLPGDI